MNENASDRSHDTDHDTDHDLPDNPRDAARALAAEAARLVASLRESVEAAQREVDQEADGRAAGDPLASSCRACPVCQLLDVVKLLRPDVVANLGTIVSELADSAREMLAAMPSSTSAGSTTPPGSPVPDAARGASGRASGAESGAPSEPEARSLPDDAADVVEIPVAERITIT